MDSLVQVFNVSKIYNIGKNECKAVNNVTISIENGEFISIMGPSGAGKSTLINLISTLDRVTKGEIIINGKNISEMTEDDVCNFRRKEVGFIFQQCNLIDTLTLRENILVSLELAGIGFKEGISRIESLSIKMNIKSVLDKYPGECSGGQRQRAAACRALVTNPSIIVADEPTGALDSKNSVELLSLLKKLNKDDGITILMVTHEPLSASYSEKVLFIRDGEIDEIIGGDNLSQKEFYHKINQESSKEINALLSEVG